MPRIGLIYGTDTGNTEEVAFKLQERIEWAAVDVFDVANCSPEHMQNYDLLILGIPTWDFGGLQADWEEFWPLLEDMSFAGKTVALFGLGDQFGYGHYFLDALGMLHDAVRDRGANIIGHYSTVGFDFEASKALTEDGQHFVGLGLDEDQQMELTDQRISEWINQLQQELQLADCA
ncbi:flavodoxin FldA [Bacterioplanes sanyensis]|uniref:Flavodoxin n=1 Tax=Bacterioplanes sanyensis TaxID=1249553 RepID=A0A222FHS8_9GAMM|nr:flavodoxin [Bacterioplanes sanyensis]ASP38319.1 flavodoxin FldA [Bacterioplanes sanyensis]